ncbi:MAG: ATP-binding protein [endosymbiont of Galathealinum brachiosum]|uniref:histidine kinase n=1 Tax=endosymbiont of Galathealinum brachiosum TaxID=2200906 RepID=A0A370DM54_9GAMM|nr:MAG: ATP-binding protein [endosymbiont of Galathealinum brachiosum]
MTELLNFKVSSSLKSVIGRDLITNDYVAIFELVKNSFDANASRVDIVFKYDGRDVEKIYVIDNGKGMDFDDFTNKWLFVAYSAKRDGTEDQDKNRTYAGNKGVGRFSCDRLGGELRIQAKTKGMDHVDILDVDWGSFEKDSTELFGDIAVFHNESEDFDFPKEVDAISSGVVVEISNLREKKSWDRKKLLSLKRHLTKLINPFGEDGNSLDVFLHSSLEESGDLKEKKKLGNKNRQAELVNGIVKNYILETLREKTTWLHVYLKSDGWLYSDLIDRGTLIYKIREKIPEYDELLDSGFNCQLFYLNNSAKLTFKKQMALSVVSFGSLFLFRNGFRVFPVGEPGNDYWKIDVRKQQGYSRYLGTRDILGRVDIAGEEFKFKESSSRDKGLVETIASDQLQECVKNKCLRRFESYVVGVNWKDKLDKIHETAERLGLDENRTKIIKLIESLSKSDNLDLLEYNKDIVSVLNEKSVYFEKSINNLESLAKDSNDVNLKKAVSSARREYEKLEKEKDDALKIAEQEIEARIKAEHRESSERQGRVAAETEKEKISTAYEDEKKRSLYLTSSESRDKDQLESFMHQIIIYAVENRQKLKNAFRKYFSLNKTEEISSDTVRDILDELLVLIEKIITTSRFATLANYKLDSEKVHADICQHIEQYLDKITTSYHHGININVINNTKGFVTNFTPIELGVILDNIVNNSNKARASRVDFIISSALNNVLNIEVVDNGNGLDSKVIEPQRIFEKGYTTTRGSGLGLYHIRKQLEKMGGEISLSDNQPDRGLGLTINVKKL